jgi:hypothetical protein
MGCNELDLVRGLRLPFNIELIDGSLLSSVGDVGDYFQAFPEDKRNANHWSTAPRMFAIALREPAYL